MTKYVTLVKQRLAGFSTWKLEHVPRDSNERVDALVIVVASLPITETILLPIYYQSDSSIATIRISQVREAPPPLSWMDPIAQYINTGDLPNKKAQAHKVKIQYAKFSLIDEQLCERAVSILFNYLTGPVCVG